MMLVRFLLMATTGQALILHPSRRHVVVKESSVSSILRCHPGPTGTSAIILQSSLDTTAAATKTATTTTLTSSDDAGIDDEDRTTRRRSDESRRWIPNALVEASLFASWCILIAVSLITMEDAFVTTLSPARRGGVGGSLASSSRPLLVTEQQVDRHFVSSGGRREWGQTTVHGLGFGQTERELLAQWGYADDNPMVATLPSYNEIMLHHRTVNVVHWTKQQQQHTPRRTSTTIDRTVAAAVATTADEEVQAAVHTVCQCLDHVRHQLTGLADQYGWAELRQQLHTPPLSDLAFAAADLGRYSPLMRETAGFEWGSCAWRHCGALADAQEAIDELDHMLGVLEPFEARFCLDIIERSLRDILAVVDWNRAAPEDRRYYETLPPYESILRDERDEATVGTIDDAYLRALQDLRVD
jgi:hypothetical protein